MNAETQVNIPLLRKAVEWAEAEAAKPPELREWVQGWWITTPSERAAEFGIPEAQCGTAYCIAGWACVSNGEEFIPGPRDARTIGVLASGAHVADMARALLGLTGFQAERLFNGRNTIADVRRIAEEIAGERL